MSKALDKTFHEAVKNGDLPLMAKALADGANIYSIIYEPGIAKTGPQSPLSVAAQQGSLDAVRFLAENDTDKAFDYVNALYMASRSGSIELVSYLEEEHVDLSAVVNREDLTCLDVAFTHAAEFCHVDLVKYFIDKGANVEARFSRALIDSARNGSLEMCETLIDAGANVDAGRSWALMHAADQGHLHICTLLIDSGADVRGDGYTALAKAASKGYFDICKLLIDAGTKVKDKNNSAFIAAARGNHMSVVDLIYDCDPAYFDELAGRDADLLANDRLCSHLARKNISASPPRRRSLSL